MGDTRPETSPGPTIIAGPGQEITVPAGQPPLLLLRWAGAGVAAALFYGVSSGSMSFINKVVLTTFGFQFPCFLMLFQMMFTAALLRCLGAVGLITLPPATLSNLRLCWLPSVLGLLHSVMSLYALSGMNVAMYTVLKRCVPLMNLLLAPLLLQKGPPGMSTVGSVALMTSGCVLTGLGDLSFDLVAYTFGMVSVFSQSLYLTLIQSLGLQSKTLSAAGIAYLYSLNCLLLLLIYTAATSELTQVLEFPGLRSPSFLLAFVLVMSMGCALNYSVFLCTTMTSALTTSVVGIIKSVVVVVVGLFTFGGVRLTLLGVAGIIFNMLGSGWYMFAKYQEKSTPREDAGSKTQGSVSKLRMGNSNI